MNGSLSTSNLILVYNTGVFYFELTNSAIWVLFNYRNWKVAEKFCVLPY